MTTREEERRGRQHREQKATTLEELALAIVRNDPEAPIARLVRRWMVAVQDDEDLLELCLRAQGNQEVAIALKRVAHEQGAKNANGDVKKVSVRKHMRQKHASTMLSKAAAEARDTLFNLAAENGKKIRDLTGDELDQLESNNIARANLYRELRKQVKGNEVVGDVLDDERFRAVVNHIGDIKELVGLFE